MTQIHVIVPVASSYGIAYVRQRLMIRRKTDVPFTGL